MNIIEVAQIGKKNNKIKVYRKSWEKGYLFIIESVFMTNDVYDTSPNCIYRPENLSYEQNVYFTLDDLTATDWEVIE